MTLFTRRRLAATMLALPASRARASGPTRPITWVVPFGAGSITDSTSRVVAQRMSELLGQPIVVENRAGASGTIGTEAVARAAPDGHTLLYGTVGTHAVQPLLNPALRYDPVRDFLPVHGLGASPNMLVVPVSRPWHSMAELVAHARANPDALTYGSSGVGTSLHLCAEMLQADTGIRAVHAPYVNGTQAMADLMAGRIDFMFDFPVTSMPHVQGGRLRALAVTDAARVATAPQVPTTAEVGFPKVALTSWAALFAPARTPAPIITRLAAACAGALRDQRVVTYFRDSGSALWADAGADEIRQLVADDRERIRQLLQRAGTG